MSSWSRVKRVALRCVLRFLAWRLRRHEVATWRLLKARVECQWRYLQSVPDSEFVEYLNGLIEEGARQGDHKLAERLRRVRDARTPRAGLSRADYPV